MGMSKSKLQQTERSSTPALFSLSNDRGMEVALTNLGATVVSVVVPDRHGEPEDVVLGYDTPAEYARNPFYFGATIGRYANRIAFGKFRLGGQDYRLTPNDGRHHLHGGEQGFSHALWRASSLQEKVAREIKFQYLSKDGEEGYPGNLSVTVTYRVAEHNELQILYEAVCDQDTIVNLTNHCYFNLAGADHGDIRAHQIKINADHFTPIDAELIPEGRLRQVDGTPFDLRQPRVIGEGLMLNDPQIKHAGGYDHNWVLNRKGGETAPAAEVYEPISGRVLKVLTSHPGIQFYTGNSITGDPPGKGGVPYQRHSGFCLETQHYPDSPNRPDFPSTLLCRGDLYRHTTTYRFSIL